MKYLITLLIFIVSHTAMAKIKYRSIEGVIKSFDKKTIVVQDILGKKILLPRSLIAQPLSGQNIDLPITESQFNEINELNARYK